MNEWLISKLLGANLVIQENKKTDMWIEDPEFGFGLVNVKWNFGAQQYKDFPIILKKTFFSNK